MHAGKRKRYHHFQWSNVFCKRRTTHGNTSENRKNHEVPTHRRKSQQQNSHQNGTIHRNRTIEGQKQTRILRQTLSRFHDRLSYCMPFITQFLTVEDFLSLRRVYRCTDTFFKHNRFRNKTEYMIKYYMNKGRSFLWVYSNITSERVQKEAIQYAKRLPNAAEIGKKLRCIPLMRCNYPYKRRYALTVY